MMAISTFGRSTVLVELSSVRLQRKQDIVTIIFSSGLLSYSLHLYRLYTFLYTILPFLLMVCPF